MTADVSPSSSCISITTVPSFSSISMFPTSPLCSMTFSAKSADEQAAITTTSAAPMIVHLRMQDPLIG